MSKVKDVRKIAFPASVVAVLIAAGTMVGNQLIARESGQPRSPNHAVLTDGDAETMELLRLVDTDKSGKVSKQEFMHFMGAEFDRLDTDKSGELDIRELEQSQFHLKSHFFMTAGK